MRGEGAFGEYEYRFPVPQGLLDFGSLSEAGLSGFDVRLWQGFTGPAGIPKPVIEKFAGAAAQALNAPDVKDALT